MNVNFKFLVASGVLLALPVCIFNLRHAIWGKSVLFFMDTGLRMPKNAKIVARKTFYPLADSNEGESLLIFDATAAQSGAYLSHSPWREMSWSHGPIPGDLSSQVSWLGQPYWGVWDSTKIWYVSRPQTRGLWGHDFQLLVIDPAKNRVYLAQSKQ